MQFIQGNNRYQTFFITLEEQVSGDNPVRLMDAFVDKLDLQKLGFNNTIHRSEGRPPYAPSVLLKLYLYGYINRIRSSRKNNYNKNKIDKHQQFIEDKVNKYLQELDDLDKQESIVADDELQIKKEKITQGLATLKERAIKYDSFQQQLNDTTDKQISTTDPDSRDIVPVKNTVEIVYNTQNVVDDKHNLIVHTQATNSNDTRALHKAASQAKQNLQLQKEDPLVVLADKGYHNGIELQQCQQDNMITHVGYKDQPSVKHIANEFLAESFLYNKATDTYTCPTGAQLTSTGTWHSKKTEAGEIIYRFKSYRTSACKTCTLRNQCTVLDKRIIQRSEFQDVIDTNNNNIKQKPQYYKRRQAICEHSFGTIKRQWGYTYTLMKGLQKVNGEMNLIMFCYNFMRTNNILGFEKMMQAIKNWSPDYNKVPGFIKTAVFRSILQPK